MAVDDVWRISFVGSQYGNEFRNVLHFRNRTGAGDIATLCAALRDNVLDGPYSGILQSVARFSMIQCRSLIPYGLYDDLAVNIPGTDDNEPLTNQAACVITLRTASISRRKRGRMYVMSPPKDALDPLTGLYTSTYMTAVGGLVTALEAYIDETDTNWDLGVFSRLNSGAHPNYTIAGFENVTQLVARNVPATFRTRRIGRGA